MFIDQNDNDHTLQHGINLAFAEAEARQSEAHERAQLRLIANAIGYVAGKNAVSIDQAFQQLMSDDDPALMYERARQMLPVGID